MMTAMETVTDAEPGDGSGTFLATSRILTPMGTWEGVNPNPCIPNLYPPSREVVPGTRYLSEQNSRPRRPPLRIEAQWALRLEPLREPGRDPAVDVMPGPWTALRTCSPGGPSALIPLAPLSVPLKGPHSATQASHRLIGRDLGNRVCGSRQRLAVKVRAEPRAENTQGAWDL